ncbi:MAG TPA: NUDIX hydrolase [Syntrophales bacterium]|nr:NUDIX hydrolase [Syntrophales bacterium]
MDQGTRASMTGQVPAVLNYNEWLKTMPESVQIEALGQPRWELWKGGKITMADMVHQDGRPLSIAELEKKIAQFDAQKAAELKLKEVLEGMADPDAIVSIKAFQELQGGPFAPIPTVEDLKFQKKAMDIPDPVKKMGKKTSSGVIVFEPETGKVWIYEPKGHFGGYQHTFPKGTVEKGLGLQETAIKEVWEETGLQARIVGYLGDYEKTTSITRYYIGVRTGGMPGMFAEETAAVKLVPQGKLKTLLNVDIDKKIADDFIAKFAEALEAGAGDAVKGFAILEEEKKYQAMIQELFVKYPKLTVEVASSVEEVPGLAQMGYKQTYETWMKQLQWQAASDVNAWMLDKELGPIVKKLQTKDTLATWEKAKEAVGAKLAEGETFFMRIKQGTAEWDAWQELKEKKMFQDLDLAQKVALVKNEANILNTVAELEIPELKGFRKYVYDAVPEGKFSDIHSKMKFVDEENSKTRALVMKRLNENAFKMDELSIAMQEHTIEVQMGPYLEWMKAEHGGKIVSFDEFLSVMNEKHGRKILPYLKDSDSIINQTWKEFVTLHPETDKQMWYFKVPQYQADFDSLKKVIEEWDELKKSTYWKDAYEKVKSYAKVDELSKTQAMGFIKPKLAQYENAANWKASLMAAPDSLHAEAIGKMRSAGITDVLEQKSEFNKFMKDLKESYQNKFDELTKPVLKPENKKLYENLKLQAGFDDVGIMDINQKVAWLEANLPEVKKYTDDYAFLVSVKSGEQGEAVLKGLVKDWEKKTIKEKYELLHTHLQTYASAPPVSSTALAQSPVGKQAIENIKQIYTKEWASEWDEVHKLKVLEKQVEKLNEEAAKWLNELPGEESLKVLGDLEKQIQGFNEKSSWEIAELYKQNKKAILDQYEAYNLHMGIQPDLVNDVVAAIGPDEWAKLPVASQVSHINAAAAASIEAAEAAAQAATVIPQSNVAKAALEKVLKEHPNYYSLSQAEQKNLLDKKVISFNSSAQKKLKKIQLDPGWQPIYKEIQKTPGWDKLNSYDKWNTWETTNKAILDKLLEFGKLKEAHPDVLANITFPANATIEVRLAALQAAVDAAEAAAAAALETASVVAQAEPMTGIVKLGTKTFDLSDPNQLANFKKNQSDALSKYKKAVLQGKTPSPQQKEAFDLLSEKDKEFFNLKLEKELGKVKAPGAVASEVKPIQEAVEVDFDDFTKYAGQKGSNEGGFYQSKANPAERYYFKFANSEEIVRNEILAGKLYQAAGVEVPDLAFVNRRGQKGVASRIVDGIKVDGHAFRAGRVAGAQENFVVDAWLGDWDVVGLNYDNLVLKEGRAFRVDVGGSLRFRAQGVAKGKAFGDRVTELESMLDMRTNQQAASVFRHATREDLIAGARKVLAITDDEIRSLVAKYGPTNTTEAGDLARKLIARKNHIAEMFPEAKVVTKVPPPKDLGKTLSKFEMDKIKQGRINGYAVKWDKYDIEDQQILFWIEKDPSAKQRLMAEFKVREDAAKRVNQVAKVKAGPATAETRPGLDTTGMHSQMYETFRGIGMQSRNNTLLRAKDIERIQVSRNYYKDNLKLLEDGVKAGKYKADDLARFKAHYKPWLDLMEQAEKEYNKQLIFKWSKDSTWKSDWKDFGFIPEIEKKVAPKVVKEVEELKFTKKVGRFDAKKVDNGEATQLGTPINLKYHGTDYQYYYEAEYNGVRIRYWPDSSDIAMAMRGKIQIMAEGASEADAAVIKDVIGKLQLNAERASLLDQEELYIRQIVYSWNNPSAFQRLTSGADAIDDLEKRVEWMRKKLNEEAGKNVTGSAVYNPQGTYQAYDVGRCFTYRPDLEGAEWESFKKKYCLHHHNTTSHSLPDLIDTVLTNGGNMAPSTDKLRRGFSWGGMSPTSDMGTGGASYFFTRIKGVSSARRSPGFVWEGRMISRTDAISYGGDMYGRCDASTIRSYRKSTIDGWIGNSGNSSNETIFKNSVGILDPDLKFIVANNETERQSIIKIFKKHGYQEFPDGRKLEDVIVSR